MSPIIFSEKADTQLSLLAISGALVFLYLFGIHGFLRSVDLGADFLIFFKAAQVFLSGGNPWLEMSKTGEPFSYPPHIVSVLIIYGLLPIKLALIIHTAVNVLSVGVMAYFANKWFIKIENLHSIRLYQALPFAIIIGNPFMAHSVFEGQLTLPSCAAVLLSWHFRQKENILISGIFLGLASIKPQVTLFYIIWLMLNMELRILIVGGLSAFLLLLPNLLNFGIVETFKSWIISIKSYALVPVNQPGSPYVVGLESFFTAVGINNTGAIFKLLSLLAIVVAFIYRRYLNDILIVNLFFIIPLTFIFGHDTGYAALMMLFVYMIFLALKSTHNSTLIITLALSFGFFFPQRFLREIDIPAMQHTRTIILLFIGYFAFRWSKPSDTELTKTY